MGKGDMLARLMFKGHGELEIHEVALDTSTGS